jgi:ribosomal protein L12E/L44/L45/RPP1/RPP2
MSDESDIEVVYVKDQRPNKCPSNIYEFILSELGLHLVDDDLDARMLKTVLTKYEVEATDSQIKDMIAFAKEKGLLNIIDECKKTSESTKNT